MPPLAAIPEKLPCESVQQLEQEFSALQSTLSLEETEETWDRIAKALARFSAVIKGGGYKYEKELVNGIKASVKPIVSAMNSERTRLSAAALDCLIIIAPRVGLAFEALVPLFVPHILRLATRTNKVYVTRSQTGLALILSYCHIPSIIPLLLAACKESKIVTGRAVALEGLLRCLNKWDWTQKEIKAKVGDVEEIIRLTGRDKDAGIRQTSRKVFEAYKVIFPDRVDAFTGPLTPVMRKYLDVKSQILPSKGVERAQSPSAQVKTKRRLSTKLDFTKSTSAVPTSTSSNARAGIKAYGRSVSSNVVVVAKSMPPPASIPSRANTASQSQAQGPSSDSHRSEQHTDYERQRVLSTASSTFSIKSAPSNLHNTLQHRPPVRLAASQSRANVADSVMTVSSGQARRVPRVVSVEPHPANRPDLSTAPKTPMRQSANLPSQKPTRVPATTGVVFPTSEPESAHNVVERKGAQRVLKPVPSSPPPKVDRPETVMSDIAKRDGKPSIFRRGAPDPKKNEKPKESFAPRRGGGVTQPTLSQLSKQKIPVSSANGAAVPKASTSVVSKRPIWGGGTKPTTSKGLPGSRVVSRNGVAKVPDATKQNKTVAVTEIQPAMVPLPESPAAAMEDNAIPLDVALSRSPKALELGGEEIKETATFDEVTTEERSEAAQGSTGSENNTEENSTDKDPEVAQQLCDEGGEDGESGETMPPHTPPFPSAEGETDEDDLDAIEFTAGNAYDSAGVPIKTPGKFGRVATGVPPERNPLAEVVLNE